MIASREVRRLILEQSRRAGVGHIASALSVADIVAVLYGGLLKGVGTAAPDRDRFILSKGHAALALYVVLHLRNFMDLETLNTFCADGSLLGVHPEHQLPGIELSTGSLGHGLSVGAGQALGARLLGLGGRTYVLLSDAELNEGSVWEAVMFAGHHKLDQLVAIIDANGQQALGATRDVLDLTPISEKFQAFGWASQAVDGHDPVALRAALRAPASGGRPTAVVALTVAGKGVSFMEGRVEWHYLPLNEEQYQRALGEVAA
jgi:transketolase